ncbi:alanine:cation symporter family protein [Flavobacteriaceae bacterium]|nr:alanine:cation symporter family protein [Flavobacteriaceae bacterium]
MSWLFLSLNMMDLLASLIQQLINSIELVMFFLVIGGGLFLLFQIRAKPLLLIKTSFQLLFSKEGGAGISRFQALSAVLASTVGLGNISGVAIAIYMGGPGVMLWMWVTAIIGAIIKFYSCTLAVLYREKEDDGSPLGGPMYYMKIALPKFGKPFAVWFSIAGLFGVLPAFTANQLTQTLVSVIDPNQYIDLGVLNWKIVIGLILALLSAFVILGGLKKIVEVTSMLVPIMVGLYFGIGVSMLAMNAEAIIPALQQIFSEAFSVNAAATGGFWALVILGVRRAVFSNESGIGNAPMYHGQSNTKNPIHEGLVASLGPILDTILVCSITGLIIIISGATELTQLNGIELTLEAFNRLFFGIGDELLLLMVFVFGVSSLFTYSYYGVKCLGYLTQKKWGPWYNYIYIVSIVFSAVATVDLVIGIIDLSFALMAIPNMITILWLSKKVQGLLFATA